MAYGRFTERAQLVILGAQRESQRFKHGYIGTEHILLGIMEEGGYAKDLLNKYSINASDVRNMIEDYLGFGEIVMPKGELLLTPRTKRLFDESFEEARKLNQKFVSPEHLLLAIIEEEEGVAYTILTQLKLDMRSIKNDLLQYLNGKDDGELEEFNQNSNEQSENISMLKKYSRDLTEQAREGKIDPVIGREKESQRILEILCRRIKNNPCLIGEPGVGKTAVVEGLAKRIVEGKVPSILENKKILSLDLSSMIAGAKYRGEFEDRLKKTMEEIKNNKNVIIFIDELHTIIGAGAAEGAIDASNILKPVLARGEIQCIGATTIEEYRKYIEKDSALERRFQPITVDEPSNEQTLKMLYGLRSKYEEHHNVSIVNDALEAAVELADKYISDRFMPDKAIDLIDEASSKIRIESLEDSPEMKKVKDKIEKVKLQKEDAALNQEFEKAANLRDEERQLEDKYEKLKVEWQENSKKRLIVRRENVAKVVSEWTNIPVEKLTEKESEKLLHLEDIIHERVVGQDDAVKTIARAVRRARVGLRDPKRPIGNFMFLGPTGVGKTELCKALAEAMFSDEKNMIRIDMSEYMEKHAVSKLIGSPPGYVGYEEGGQLTEAVRRKPYSVILLDEIEKAHPDVFNILLQIMEDGRLTDGKGRLVSFKNTIIIMTSNVGAHTIKKQKTMGFNTNVNKETDYEKMKENIMEELKKSFRPEFINRIDETIVFHKLNEENMSSIMELMLKSICNRLKDNRIEIEFNDDSKKFLLNKGTDIDYGARPLRRVLTQEIEDKLSEELLMGKVKFGERVLVSVKEDKLIFNQLEKK